jgi:hypothetical protein
MSLTKKFLQSGHKSRNRSPKGLIIKFLGSISFARYSGADPWQFGTDPDLDPAPAIFVSNLQEGNYKLFFFLRFFAYYF